jgi:Flp pilus assembly protein TadG
MNLKTASGGRSFPTRSLGKRARARSLAGDESGQSMVEMALCLPMLLIIVTGIISFSIAQNNYLELRNAAGMGGRVLVESRGDTDPCKQASAAIYQGAPFLGTKRLSIAYSFYDQAGNSQGSAAGASCPSAQPWLIAKGTAKLTLTYPCNLGVYGHQFWPGCTLTAQTTEYVQ